MTKSKQSLNVSPLGLVIVFFILYFLYSWGAKPNKPRRQRQMITHSSEFIEVRNTPIQQIQKHDAIIANNEEVLVLTERDLQRATYIYLDLKQKYERESKAFTDLENGTVYMAMLAFQKKRQDLIQANETLKRQVAEMRLKLSNNP